MTISYEEFKKKFPIGSTVASPENTYPGECVSYVRQYMAWVHGVKTGPLGNAVDFATNATFLKYYTKVSSPKVGDIIVWGNDPGTWTSQYGHIAIFDGPGYMMNQNFNSSRKVSRNPVFTPGFIGYYRKKGTQQMVTKLGLDVIYRFLLGTTVSRYGLDNYLGKVTFDTAYKKVLASKAYANKVAAAKQGEIDVHQLPSAIRKALGL